MNIIAYTIYLTISCFITVRVGKACYSNGWHFIKPLFLGHDELARAVNKLLLTGFYLVNLGIVAWNLHGWNPGRAVRSCRILPRLQL